MLGLSRQSVATLGSAVPCDPGSVGRETGDPGCVGLDAGDIGTLAVDPSSVGRDTGDASSAARETGDPALWERLQVARAHSGEGDGRPQSGGHEPGRLQRKSRFA